MTTIPGRPTLSSPPNLAEPAAWVKASRPMWERAQALLGGTDAMRAAGRVYLPSFPSEPDEQYRARLGRAVLHNFYRAIARNMAGRMCAEHFTVEDSALPGEFLQNVDRQGRDAAGFVHALIFDLLTMGSAHILTDYPRNPGVTTLAEQQALGLRPYWVSLPATCVIDATTRNSAGLESVSHVRWMSRERFVDPSSYETLLRERVHVLDEIAGADGSAPQVRKREWVRESIATGVSQFRLESEELLQRSGGEPLSRITWSPIVAQRQEAWRGIASLDDIAHKCIEHWQSSSDQRNILTVSRFPMLVQIGLAEPIRDIGPGISIHSAGATEGEQKVELYYLEPTGSSIQQGWTDLERIEQHAEALALRLVLEGGGTRTRADAAADNARDQSPLQQLAGAIEDAVNRALRDAALWYGIDEARAGFVSIPRDYSGSDDDERALGVLQFLRARGDISRLGVIEELQARNILRAYNEQAEALRLAEEQASLDNAAFGSS